MKKITNLLILTCLLFSILTTDSCKKDKSMAVLTTKAATAVTVNSATSGGDITDGGGADITARGVCWSTSANPTISGSHTTDGTGTGSFSSNITGLTASTLYHVRAYATNSVGTAYGNEVTFTTSAPGIATLTTAEPTDVLLTTATSGGVITSDGGASITARGVCYGTTASPDITGTKTSDGTGTGTFPSSITGLTPSTTYYIRAYATNSAGTAYGNELTFTTADIVVPTLTTVEISSITLISAVSGGIITSDGGADVTARGVCWGTTASPTIAGSHTTNGAGTGTFSSDITGLTPGTTYYVRAYATNSVGTAYGNEVSFPTTPVAMATLTTTVATAVTTTTASTGGNITDAGGGTISARGVCYSTTTGPTTTDPKTTNGSGTGTFASSLTGLTPGATYYVRAYAVNSAGTAYGNEISFTTDAVALATLTTAVATAVTQTTGTSGGTITNDGGGSVTARGVCYALTAAPTITDGHTSNGTGTGTFASPITGLTPGTMYHVRAYATNPAGTAYGNEITFTTDPLEVPTLTTTAATAVTLTTATTGGNVTADGGASVTARGVCYALTANPTISNSITTDGAGTGIFTSDLTGLTPGTMYHVRAYATNSVGTGYGNDITFTTGAVTKPTVTTTDPSAITLTTATSGGNVTDEGGGAVTVRGVCWSTSQNPTTTDPHTSDGAGTGIFTSSITGLTQGTLYYVRAYATNSAGTAYGAQVLLNTYMADNDGNTYKTVTIGTQVWMAENLKTTLFNTGAAIPNVTDNTAWSALVTPGYCWYINSEALYKDVYGGMYNWYAVNTGTLCPTGWHVPTDDEFKTLESYLGITDPTQLDLWGSRGTDQGSQMKNTTGWADGQNGTNTSGWSALPGGYRYSATGTFNDRGNLSYWWTATELDATRSWYRRLDGSSTQIYRAGVEKQAGKYIRCVKD